MHSKAFFKHRAAFKSILLPILLCVLGAPLASEQTKALVAGSVPTTLPQVILQFKVVGIPQEGSDEREATITRALARNDFSWLADHKLDVLSEPSVTTLDGLEAQVDNTRDMTYPTQYSVDKAGRVSASHFRTRRVGVEIEATPIVLPGNAVSYDLKCTITSFVGWADVPSQGRQPIFNVRQITTQKLLINGKSDFLWVGPNSVGASDPSGNKKPMRDALIVTVHRGANVPVQ
jgi:hypothetical protein